MTKKQMEALSNAAEKTAAALALIQEAMELVEPVRDSEEEKLENMSDKAREGEKGRAREEAVGGLSETVDTLTEMVDSLNEISDRLEGLSEASE